MNNNINWEQRGWICPKCGSVWAPRVNGCYNCNKSSNSISAILTLCDKYNFNHSFTRDNNAYKNISIEAQKSNYAKIIEILDNLKN